MSDENKFYGPLNPSDEDFGGILPAPKMGEASFPLDYAYAQWPRTKIVSIPSTAGVNALAHIVREEEAKKQ